MSRTSLGSAGLLWLALVGCRGANPEPVRVVVPQGASVRAVAESLSAHGVITNATWFRFRARVAGLDRRLQPGLYQFPPRGGAGEVLHRLVIGDAMRVRITLPEGATLFDLARVVEQRANIPREAFLEAARDSALRRSFNIPGSSVEGWLLPETFDFPALTDAHSILERFLAARRSAWDSTWDRRAAAAGLSRGDLLTLASIVEAEAKLPTDLPLIAAVYRNRLRIGMPLQADPGIQYAYLLRNGTRKSRMYHADYDFPSPWNTYLHPGLPPGPIGNPTSAAIEAVLTPAETPDLYFVAGPDGAHRFSRTYDEHLKTIRKIRRAKP
ncbi:MAG: endolytic transglycosylase MltG [Gemmatimonadota bacterium]